MVSPFYNMIAFLFFSSLSVLIKHNNYYDSAADYYSIVILICMTNECRKIVISNIRENKDTKK